MFRIQGLTEQDQGSGFRVWAAESLFMVEMLTDSDKGLRIRVGVAEPRFWVKGLAEQRTVIVYCVYG